MNKHLKKTALVFVLILFLNTVSPAGSTVAPLTDHLGHWAEAEITRWIGYGVVKGDGNGLTRPNDIITRSEYAAMINRIFGYSTLANENFADIASWKWYADDMSIAKASGYYKGNSQGNSMAEKTLTREEAMVVLDRIFQMNSTLTTTSAFSDFDTVSDYAKDAILTYEHLDVLHGMPDGTVRPKANITRAEALKLLDNLVNTYFISSQTMRDKTITGNVVVNVANVTLKDMVIEGNLYLTEGIGDGEVYLNNVKVTGEIFIAGGGEDSIYLQDVTTPKCTVKKLDGKAHLVASGKTSITQTSIQSGVILEETNLQTGHSGFVDATITGTIPIDDQINLLGDFNNISIDSHSRIKLDNCNVSTVEVKDALNKQTNDQLVMALEIIKTNIGTLINNAHGCSITISNASRINNMSLLGRTTMNLSRDSMVDDLVVGANGYGTTIVGDGTILRAQINSNGVTINGQSTSLGSVLSFGPSSGGGAFGEPSTGGSTGGSPSGSALIADTTDNDVNHDIQLTIKRNSGFAANISEITIDGQPVPLVLYSVSGDVITIDKEAFVSKAKDGFGYRLDTTNDPATHVIETEYMNYDIVVKSSGYQSLSAEQRIYTENDTSHAIFEEAVYNHLHNNNAYPVEDLEEIAIGDTKQYYAVYKLGTNSSYFIVKASAVDESDLSYTSSDTAVITVSDNGLAEALTIGTATMTVSFNSKEINVPMKTGMKPPTLTKDSTGNIEGADIQLTVSGTGVDAWLLAITGVKTNSNVVTHSVSGDEITVESAAFTSPSAVDYIYTTSTAVKVVDGQQRDTVTQHITGYTKVYVEATDYISASVYQDITLQTWTTTPAVVNAEVLTTASDNKLVMGVEETNQLYMKLILEDDSFDNNDYVKPGYPKGGYMYHDSVNHRDSDIGIVWTSSNTSVASVDQNGLVSGQHIGEATITATYRNTTATYTIIVNKEAVALTAELGVKTSTPAFRITFTDTVFATTVQAVSIIDNNGDPQLVDPSHYTVGASYIEIDMKSMTDNYSRSGETYAYVSAGNSVIRAGAHNYSFVVEAGYYADSSVVQLVSIPNKNMVIVNQDVTDNALGQDIVLTFTDDLSGYDFKNSIVSLSVNDTAIPISYFTIGNGTITLDNSLFLSDGAFIIKIQAVDNSGVFNLGSYTLQVGQSIRPSVTNSAVGYVLDGDRLIAIYADTDVTTSSALHFEIKNTGNFVTATFSTSSSAVTTTGSAVMAEYVLPTSYPGGQSYIVGNLPVISISAIAGSDPGRMHPVVRGLTSGFTLTTINNYPTSLVVLAEGESPEADHAILSDGDIVQLNYNGDLIMTWVWTSGEFVAQ